MKFRAAILLNNINPYVIVTARRAARLKPGWKRPLPVLVQVNGQPNPPWPINMMPAGDGSFLLFLHGFVRKASKTQAGDRVEISVVFDADYRPGPAHEIPPAFKRKLAATPKARAAWDRLSPSRKKEVLRYLATLKSDDARTRNIEKAIRVLSGSAERFLARDWNATSPQSRKRADNR